VQIAGPTAQQAGMLTLWSAIAPMQLVPGRDRTRELLGQEPQGTCGRRNLYGL